MGKGENIISEFGSACNLAELHVLLSKKKKERKRTAWWLSVGYGNLYSRDITENFALIQYVIKGANLFIKNIPLRLSNYSWISKAT